MNTKQKAEYIARQLTERGVSLPEAAATCIEIALDDLEIMYPQAPIAVKTRKARDPQGNDIIWHMFFVDENGKMMALIEKAGSVKTMPATWVQFTKSLPSGV